MAQDMTNFEEAVDQVIIDSERLHLVVNGTAVDEVVVEDGTTIPTVRKALLDNLYFKTPPIPWVYGSSTTVFNQIYEYKADGKITWWYAPGASKSTPVRLPADPFKSTAWRLYTDANVLAEFYAKLSSPLFQGDPRVPTPPMDDKSLSIANTTFVVDYVDSIFEAMAGMEVTIGSLVVRGLSELTNTTINGTLTVRGPLNASNFAGRFKELTLTGKDSVINFNWTDRNHPTWTSTMLDPYNIETHLLTSDVIHNGAPVSDNNTVHFDGRGNNFFDYVYIRGNSQKDVQEPTLTVDGVTQVKDLKVTGKVEGIVHSVDGLDIYPNYLETTNDARINGDLQVGGSVVIQGNAMVQDLSTNTFKSNQQATFEGNGIVANKAAITTLTGTTATIDTGNFTNCNVNHNLQVNGDVSLNAAGAGTTYVHNIQVSGTLIGWMPDYTGETLNCGGVNASGDVSINGNLSVGGSTTIEKIRTTKLEFESEDIAGATGTWTPSGNANMYVVEVTGNLNVATWPGVTAASEEDKPNPFSVVIYFRQDATGHQVTFSDKYAILSATPVVNNKANSVTLCQLTYPGFGDIVDVIIAQR